MSFTPEQARKQRERVARYRRNNREKVNAATRRHLNRVKIECYEHYGGIVCVCCGERHIDLLTLHHIDGDGGGRHRQRGGKRFYLQLRAKGYPAGFEVRCYNCNIGASLAEGCPHRKTNNGSDYE